MPQADSNNQEDEDEDEAVDDMQLAWEMLEVARKIYSAAEPSDASSLAGKPGHGLHDGMASHCTAPEAQFQKRQLAHARTEASYAQGATWPTHTQYR